MATILFNLREDNFLFVLILTVEKTRILKKPHTNRQINYIPQSVIVSEIGIW